MIMALYGEELPAVDSSNACVQVLPGKLHILRHLPRKQLDRKLLVVSARATRGAARNRLRRYGVSHVRHMTGSMPYMNGRAKSSHALSHHPLGHESYNLAVSARPAATTASRGRYDVICI